MNESALPVIYRRHNCERKHRTLSTLAKCIWPRAAWILGDGKFATVAYCRVTTVALHADLNSAQSAMSLIDSTGCGGMCSRRHKMVQLEIAP